jgi:hypothetical protein
MRRPYAGLRSRGSRTWEPRRDAANLARVRIRERACGCLLLAACTEAASHRAAPPYQPSAGDEDGGHTSLDVDPLGTSSGPLPPEEGEGGDEGFGCGPEEVQACPCPDGPGMGVQSCLEGMWGPCLCDAGTTGGDGGSDGSGESEGGAEAGDSGGDGPAPATEVCFPGADNQYTTCLEVHAVDPDAPPEGYAYPDALGGDPNYRRPIALLDLEAEDPDLSLAPNFTLGEFAQAYKGRWAIVQPHAVAAVQALRDAVGPIDVNSGYRSPDYNAEIGGAGYSRHMYGDGFDLDPIDASIATLQAECESNGGMLVEYETHVHCDWRFDDVDEAFFGPADAAMGQGPTLAGELHHHGRVWWASTSGFDEGMPVLRWTAWDRDGHVLVGARAPMFVAPAAAVRVALDIGAAVHRESIDTR